MTALETSLLAEKQRSTAIFSKLTEAQQGIEVLQNKYADASSTNDLLQDSLKRFISYVTLLQQLMMLCYFLFSIF